jgi:hypothetical protein
MDKEIELHCAIASFMSADKVKVFANGDTGGIDIASYTDDEWKSCITLDYKSAKKLQAFINQSTRRGGRKR